MNQQVSPGNALRLKWWNAPHVLGLDAPVVAMVWQIFLAGVFQIQLPPAAPITLGAVVWFIYLFDRLMDTQKAIPPTCRHRFTARHRPLIKILLTTCFILVLVGISRLPKTYIQDGFKTGLVICVYLAIVHGFKPGLMQLPSAKEFMVGFGFALGVCLPIWSSGLEPTIWMGSIGLFGLLCWTNCRLIDCWENQQPWHPFECVVLVLGSMVCMTSVPMTILICHAMALLFLMVIHFYIAGRNRDLARILADCALLVPLVTRIMP